MVPDTSATMVAAQAAVRIGALERDLAEARRELEESRRIWQEKRAELEAFSEQLVGQNGNLQRLVESAKAVGCVVRFDGHERFVNQALAAAVAFKSFVHKRLDEAGVPADPEPEQNAKHGCRIEGRLNWLECRSVNPRPLALAESQAREAELRAALYGACQEMENNPGSGLQHSVRYERAVDALARPTEVSALRAFGLKVALAAVTPRAPLLGPAAIAQVAAEVVDAALRGDP